MIEIPTHLKDFVTINTVSEDTIILKLVCNCGTSTFFVLENLLDEKEEESFKEYENRLRSWRNIENYIDPVTNVRYLVIRDFFGKIRDRIPVSDIRDTKRTHVLKVKCSKCGEEKVIFDNRYHGYGVAKFGESALNDETKFRFKSKQKDPVEVEIKIINDLTADECFEALEENDSYDISNAFTNIQIFTMRDGKRKEIFSEETS